MGAPIQISVYDDKLIVWNEGSLPEDLTFEDLKKKHSSRPHNPFLANTFFKSGLIEA
jgi:ATP-dependent DNA helicase RecG